MASINIISPPIDRMWGNSSEVLQKSHTILRLVRSYKILEKEDWADLTPIWKGVIENNFASLAEGRSHIFSLLQKRVLPIYEPEILLANSIEEIKTCAARFLKDPISLETKPVISSHRGVKGLTLLGRYNRYSSKKDKICAKEFVVKLTDTIEVLSNQIYTEFSTGFSESNHRFGFLVPKSAGIDFGNNIHLHANGSKANMDPSIAKQLKSNIEKLAKMFEEECQRKDPIDVQNVMLSERIDGENLFDFARHRYPHLTDVQKQILMKQMGKIEALDLFLGHNDRGFTLFSEIVDGKKVYDFDEFIPANLGNVLVDLPSNSEADPILYAIDNGIELEFSIDSESNEAHLSFLEKLFNMPHEERVKTLAQKMQASFVLALEPEDLTGFQHVPGLKLNILHAELKPFKEDVLKFGMIHFSEGIAKMMDYLLKTLIPRWEKRAKSELDPALASILQKRFNFLKNAK